MGYRVPHPVRPKTLAHAVVADSLEFRVVDIGQHFSSGRALIADDLPALSAVVPPIYESELGVAVRALVCLLVLDPDGRRLCGVVCADHCVVFEVFDHLGDGQVPFVARRFVLCS